MVTYLYWIVVILLLIATIYFIGIKSGQWKAALILCLFILFSGWSAYYFYFEQIFVKRWGGVMSISIPEGQLHMGATWKDDNLWIENYDPKTNTCHFSEYSKGNLLEGRVNIKDCNPLMPK